MKKYILLAATLLVAFVASAQIKIQSLPQYNLGADNYYVPIAGPGGVTYKVLGKLLSSNKPDSIRIKSDSLFEFRGGVKTLIGVLTSGGVITGTVSTFNGRQGTVVPVSGDYTFAMLGGKPSTLSGYGITDAANQFHSHDFSTLLNKPSTLSGYGITDAAALSHNHTFASLLSRPTTLVGYGITDAAPLIHQHTLSSLSQSGASLNQVPKWNGSAWIPADETGGGTTNLSIIRTPTNNQITNSTGTGVTIPSVDAVNAGLATPGMLGQLNASFYLRNTVSGAGFQKQLYSPNDSTAIVKAQSFGSSTGELIVDSSASNDSLINIDLRISSVPQFKVSGLTTTLDSKLNYELAGTASTISTATTKRLVEVTADETNSGKRTLYFHTGDSLMRITTTTVAKPIPYMVEKIWKLNFSTQYLATNSISGWAGLPTAGGTAPIGTTFSSLRDTTNTATGLGMQVTTAFDGEGGGSPPYDQNDNGIFCNHLVYNHYWSWSGTTSEFKLTGLTVGKYYKIGILGNSETFEGTSEKFAVGATETAVKATGGNYGDLTCSQYYGTNPALVWLNNIQPQPDGTITITCTKTAGTKGVINALVLIQSSTSAP